MGFNHLNGAHRKRDFDVFSGTEEVRAGPVHTRPHRHRRRRQHPNADGHYGPGRGHFGGCGPSTEKRPAVRVYRRVPKPAGAAGDLPAIRAGGPVAHGPAGGGGAVGHLPQLCIPHREKGGGGSAGLLCG